MEYCTISWVLFGLESFGNYMVPYNYSIKEFGLLVETGCKA